MKIFTTLEQMDLIESAANYLGVSISSFVLEAVIERASTVLNQVKQITLTESQSKRFIDLLDNPPEPNENLIKLIKNQKHR